MAKHSQDNRALSPNRMVDNFIVTFGDRGAVRGEIQQYWKDKGSFTSPEELYAHLMQQQVDKGKITSERAAVLQSHFKDTFNPEHSTGFIAKHRDQLITGLARMYADSPAAKQGTLWKIEGDIGNLSGLNKALERSAVALQQSDPEQFAKLVQENKLDAALQNDALAERLARKLADKVLHTISQIASEQFAEMGSVIPIRKGGDEISFILSTKSGICLDHLNGKIESIQKAVGSFTKDAGLMKVPHGKDELITLPNGNTTYDRRNAGVGLGLVAADMSQRDDKAIRGHVDATIADSKARSLRQTQRLTERGSEPPILQHVDLVHLSETLKKPEYKSASSPTAHQSPSLNPSAYRTIPDEQRLISLKKQMQSAGTETLTDSENKLLAGTFSLLRRNDPVVNLPMFENMQAEQVPYFRDTFRQRAGGKAKLVNIDFNNMAGGNALSEEVGNTMARVYRDTVLEAMSKAKMDEFFHCVSVRPGGKFAVLVSDDVCGEKFQLFENSLKSILQKKSAAPLVVDADTLTDVKKKLMTDQGLRKIYAEKGRTPFNEQGNLTISHIISKRTSLAGADVAMAVSEQAVDYNQPLGAQLRVLEKATDARHNSIVDERRAAEGQPPLPTGGMVERLSQAPATGLQR